MNRIVLLSVLILLANHVFSQWNHCDIPSGATIEIIEHSGGIFIAGDSYGNIYRSSDGGNSWTRTHTGLFNDKCLSMTLNGSEYLSANKTSVQISNDQGLTWNNVSANIPTSGTFLHIDRVNGALIAATGRSEFFESHDNGISWVLKSSFYYNFGSSDTVVYEMVGNGSRLIIATNVGFFRSDDNAATWTNYSPGFTITSAIRLKEYNGVLYACVFQGFYRSFDNGISWSNSYASYTKDVTVSTNAITILSGGLIVRSIDNGSTWTVLNHVNGSNSYYSVVDDGTKLLIGTFASGIHQTSDNGTTWTAVNNGLSYSLPSALTEHNGSAFVATSAGIFESSDGGVSWTIRNSGLPVNLTTTIFSDGSALWISTGVPGGIYNSSDNGISWNFSTGIYSTRSMFKIGPNLIATADYHLNYSNDNGTNWNQYGSSLGHITASTEINDNLIVACEYGIHSEPQLFFFKDDGLTLNHWVLLPNNFEISDIEGNLSDLFAIHHHGTLWQSADSGRHWIHIPASQYNFNDILFYGNILYAGTQANGIIVSTDFGQTWNPIPSPSSEIFKLYIHQNSLYASVRNEGLFVNHTILTEISEAGEEEFTISPNPGSGIYNIQLKESIVNPSVTVYNLTGEQIPAKLVQNDISRFRLEFNAAEGIYFIRIHDGIKQYSRKVILTGR